MAPETRRILYLFLCLGGLAILAFFNTKDAASGYQEYASIDLTMPLNTASETMQSAIDSVLRTESDAQSFTWNASEIDVTRNVLELHEFHRSVPHNPLVQQTTEPPLDHDPLNIVLFYADDWTMKVLGALNPQVKTPNIDRMANKGMLFTHNCVTTSICWISRATLATGTYAAIHQMMDPSSPNLFNYSVGVPWNETLYPLLKKNGYYTGLVGKWHAPQSEEEMKMAFDYERLYYGVHWEERNGKPRHVTDLNNEDALDFLQNRPKDQNFMLTLAFFATHAVDYVYPPYQPQNSSMEWYADDEITRPVTATEDHWKRLPSFFTEENEARKRCMNRFENATSFQRHVKDLYRLATEVDVVVGNVLAELEKQNVLDKTLVMFTTDNGNLHGEHGMAEKWYPWEESIRVPLVIQDPRMPETNQGKRNSDFTLSVDLAPTILSAANIPLPSFMQGRDISQLYIPQSPVEPWRQDFFYEWNTGDSDSAEGHMFPDYYLPAVFALVRKDYKYYVWPQQKVEQLFHVESDPYEEWDVVKSNTTVEALKIMKARYTYLKEWAQSGKAV